MPLSVVELVWFWEGLNGPVLVGWGKLLGERPDLAAAAGKNLYLFTPSDAGYVPSQTVEVRSQVLSLNVGLAVAPPQYIILGLDDRLVIYGIRQGVLAELWETEPEPGARFVDLNLSDIDGDGRQEVIAASEGRDSLFIYRLVEVTAGMPQLEILAIRVLPGPAQKVTTVPGAPGSLPLIVAAYKNDSTSGLLTLTYTERGLAEGPALESLPASVASLTAGDLSSGQGEELAWGGGDGSVRIMEVGQLTTLLTTNNLGSTIPALIAGHLARETTDTLIAGTPGGYLFGFTAPVESTSPDWAVRIGRPINSMALNEDGLLGLGTADGGVQVWLLTGTL